MGDFEIGALTQSVDTLTKEVGFLRKDVAALQHALATFRGGWKVASSLGAVVGAVVSFLIELFFNIPHK